MCTCELEPGEENLFIHVEVYAGEDSAVVEVKMKHDHISKIIKNNKVLLEQDDIVTAQSGDKSKLNLKDIIDFAHEVKIEDIEELIARQIKYNSAISKEGIIHINIQSDIFIVP
ncbi:MAG: hypothetical protein PHX08_15940 [Lachnospiraceae bacterium]|nr:hypothetical protein [Lachnospiraceae bacterium]